MGISQLSERGASAPWQVFQAGVPSRCSRGLTPPAQCPDHAAVEMDCARGGFAGMERNADTSAAVVPWAMRSCQVQRVAGKRALRIASAYAWRTWAIDCSQLR